jgi:ketosteroid isomerase-like protein
LLRRCAPRNDAENDRWRKIMSDLEELTSLNRDYIASVQNCDVKRFDEILAPEFYCSNPDKSLVDRAGFLKQTAVPVTIKGLVATDVKIRIMGDFAIIHGATSYTTADGKPAAGRYTDCWAKQNGRWLAVSAHVSR